MTVSQIEMTRAISVERTSPPVSDSNDQVPATTFFDALVRSAAQSQNDQKWLEKAIHDGARHEAILEPAQLLALQARVYRYSHRLELMSRLVDKSTSSLRELLRTQS